MPSALGSFEQGFSLDSSLNNDLPCDLWRLVTETAIWTFSCVTTDLSVVIFCEIFYAAAFAFVAASAKGLEKASATAEKRDF